MIESNCAGNFIAPPTGTFRRGDRIPFTTSKSIGTVVATFPEPHGFTNECKPTSPGQFAIGIPSDVPNGKYSIAWEGFPAGECPNVMATSIITIVD